MNRKVGVFASFRRRPAALVTAVSTEFSFSFGWAWMTALGSSWAVNHRVVELFQTLGSCGFCWDVWMTVSEIVAPVGKFAFYYLTRNRCGEKMPPSWFDNYTEGYGEDLVRSAQSRGGKSWPGKTNSGCQHSYSILSCPSVNDSAYLLCTFSIDLNYPLLISYFGSLSHAMQ